MTGPKFHVRNVLSGFAILGIWTVGYVLARIFFRTLPSADGYALLVGWWLVAYVCSKTTLGLQPALVAGGSFALLFVVLGSLGTDLFYHDIVGVSLGWLFLLGVLQGAIVASPIAFDSVVTIFFQLCARGLATAGFFRTG
jgi:hypothetical protein